MENVIDVKRIRSLLKEYIERANEIRLEVKSLEDASMSKLSAPGIELPRASLARRQALASMQDYFDGLLPHLRELARHISQLLEHADLEATLKIELQVLLGDLQATITRTQQALQQASVA